MAGAAMRCSRFGAIKGRQYWSVAEGAWRILITGSHIAGWPQS